MSKRDYIQEVLEKKQRFFYGNYRGTFKLLELESDYQIVKQLGHPPKTYASMYLVGIAACLEVSVRNAIKTFIDSGLPYIECVYKFKDFLTFDLNITKALYDKQVSFGELISHFLPINNVKNIITHFGILLDGSFSSILGEIREFVEPNDEELFGTNELNSSENPIIEEPKLIVNDVNSLMASLEKLFITRHIIAHEAIFESVSNEDLEEFFGSAGSFLYALEEIVEQTLNPKMPRTAFGMSIVELGKADNLREEMIKTLENFQFLMLQELRYQNILLPNEDSSNEVLLVENLKKAQESFEQYLEAEINFEEYLYQPISTNSSRSNNAYLQSFFYKQRIERLNELIFAFTPAVE